LVKLQKKVMGVRADAQRNYDRIVEVARVVFREQGYDASLDEIAKRAEVGPGTLYRHFPTRDALLDAVMQSWVDGVEMAADKSLATEGDSRQVLLDWFERYMALISAHKGYPAKITSAMGNPDSPIRTKCQALAGATDRVLDELKERGSINQDVEAMQIVRLIGGIATIADQSDLAASVVTPMLEVVADGILK
jgi:AcrR family transcriptional regulator